jgi:uncharacterized membrane protein YozB (DUF420 family)
MNLPAIEASLNGVASLLLVAGFVAIKRKLVTVHRRCMVAAFGASTLFLAAYLTHHARAGHVVFQGGAIARPIYLAILWTHTPLALVALPLSIATLVLGLRGRIEKHRRLARWTWPIWLYVSVTGVVVWWFLYGGVLAPVPGAAPVPN